MEEQLNESNRPVNPRRKKRTKMQIFKETYLPVIIAGVALILIIVFIIGSITRGVQKNRAEKNASLAASSSLAAEEARLEQIVNDLISEAEILMSGYDYQTAIELLNSFEGDIMAFPQLNDKILECEAAQKNLVTWSDPNQIPNLSFQHLVADLSRGLQHTSGSVNYFYVTIGEFSKILQQLYDNGYILVGFDDFTTTETTANGKTIYKTVPLQLPKGKKPIMITQTNVNYNYYLVDSENDSDFIPDISGAGIAHKLLWDGSTFTCEMVNADGQSVTGDFDLIPILEKFIASHPDFSYRGARATIALTGYNGLFGYRTHPSAKEWLGETEYQKAIQDAKNVAAALRQTGYTLACYTYENMDYGTSSLNQINNDLRKWADEVVPILGKLDILVYAKRSDITDNPVYSGDKYKALHEQGFRYYMGICKDGAPWINITDDYVRQGAIMVTGSNLAHHADWFTNMFDASSILDSARGNVPR